jgi:fructuronate reductase
LLRPILAKKELFVIDLAAYGLDKKIIGFFGEFNAGPGAVRKTLEKYLPV